MNRYKLEYAPNKYIFKNSIKKIVLNQKEDRLDIIVCFDSAIDTDIDIEECITISFAVRVDDSLSISTKLEIVNEIANRYKDTFIKDISNIIKRG